MSMSNNVVLIMAGGVGKRMNSDLPKVLHMLHGKPMILHVVDSALQTDDSSMIYVIVGKYSILIQNAIPVNPRVKYIYQNEPLGTGHAIQCCREELLKYREDTRVLILSGDVPLFTSESMRYVLVNPYPATVVTTYMEKPFGYGRIVSDKIVEEKDCSEEERAICTVNCGIYAFNNKMLCDRLPMLNNNNAQNEYYLTSIFEKYENGTIGFVDVPREKQYEIIGVNTQEQLNELLTCSVVR